VVTAYTADHGKVSLLGKGVRGPKPRFGAALEIFAYVDLVYYHKESRELQLISQATLLQPFLRLGENSIRYGHGVAVLELLLKVLTGQAPPGRLFDLSMRTLEVMETCSVSAIPAVFRAFEIKAISFLGHRPELYLCVECGSQADENPGAGFSPRMGGVVCRNCVGQVPDLLNLPTDTWRLLRLLLTSTLAEIEENAPADSEVAAVARLVEPFLQAHVERYESLRAIRMLSTLAMNQQPART
jgi:DNA repair protein RecO (recombination protein O)